MLNILRYYNIIQKTFFFRYIMFMYYTFIRIVKMEMWTDL